MKNANLTKSHHPSWLKVPLPAGQNFHQVRKLVRDHHLNTVCHDAHCPNIGDCWNKQTATFMILGKICTRNCHFCAITSGKPSDIDQAEPIRIAEAVAHLKLKYAVITSVTRDDLPDGGADIFVETIQQIRKHTNDCKVEILIPDLQGNSSALQLIIDAKPDVLNHNLETIPRLYPKVRPGADFQRSIHVLKMAREAGLITKTGLMLGLGETNLEIFGIMHYLQQIQCQIITLGQYLQPSPLQLPIARYVSPEEFQCFREYGLTLGFRHIESGPLVRSSYHASTYGNNKLN
jgi:lipoyl synthase